MPDKNTQYNKNERFYQLYEEFYLTLMQHKSEFEIAQPRAKARADPAVRGAAESRAAPAPAR